MAPALGSTGGDALEGVADPRPVPVGRWGRFHRHYSDRRPKKDLEEKIPLPARSAVLAETQLLLGDNLLPYLVLALGGAMAVGSVLALVRPPEAPPQKGDLSRAPVARTVAFALIGFLAALWAFASLVAG